MDISSFYNISSEVIKTAAENSSAAKGISTGEFGSIFDKAMESLNTTNAYLSDAENEKIRWALGETENTHQLTNALQKASAALSYTVAIRDKLLEAYKEIMQTGLECMGDIDLYHICEVTALAAKSLATISSNYVLEISHMGVIKAVLAPLCEELQRQVLKCIAEKNLHEIRKLCEENGIEETVYQSIETLVSTYGGYKKVLTALKKASLSDEVRVALTELETICSILAVNKLAKNINIDFSIVNDMGYYSGILYKGFIKGIPNSILSGGQYDQLMERMGKKAGAIGFAVYLDSLDRLDPSEKVYDFDVVFLYDEKSDLRLLMKEAKDMRDKGESVLLERSIPEKMTYRKLLKLEDGEVKILERND